MICSKCNTEVVSRTVNHAAHCMELGEFITHDVEACACDCGSTTYFNYDQARRFESIRNKLIALLVSTLPLGSFIPYEKARHPKTLVITTKIGKQTLIYRPSLEQHLSTGDGRLNLVAELAKHNVTNSMIVSRIMRQRMVEA